MSTKDYSSAQENMVATYLEWSITPGSGGTRFGAGDVISNNFLGECKTHETSGNKIVFRQDVWKKICDQSMTDGKLPVLIVDDGSRKLYNTYCLSKKPVDFDMLPHGQFHVLPYSKNFKKQLNFDYLDLQNKTHKKPNTILVIDWVEPVVLMNLETFKEYSTYL